VECVGEGARNTAQARDAPFAGSPVRRRGRPPDRWVRHHVGGVPGHLGPPRHRHRPGKMLPATPGIRRRPRPARPCGGRVWYRLINVPRVPGPRRRADAWFFLDILSTCGAAGSWEPPRSRAARPGPASSPLYVSAPSARGECTTFLAPPDYPAGGRLRGIFGLFRKPGFVVFQAAARLRPRGIVGCPDRHQPGRSASSSHCHRVGRTTSGGPAFTGGAAPLPPTPNRRARTAPARPGPAPTVAGGSPPIAVRDRGSGTPASPARLFLARRPWPVRRAGAASGLAPGPVHLVAGRRPAI